MYRNGIKSKIILRKRALRKLVDIRTREIKVRFNYEL